LEIRAIGCSDLFLCSLSIFLIFYSSSLIYIYYFRFSKIYYRSISFYSFSFFRFSSNSFMFLSISSYLLFSISFLYLFILLLNSTASYYYIIWSSFSFSSMKDEFDDFDCSFYSDFFYSLIFLFKDYNIDYFFLILLELLV